jgi:leucyl aminopeptidase
MHPGLATGAKRAIPLHAVAAKDAKAWLAKQKRAGLVSASGFAGAAGVLAALPDAKGGVAAWVLGLGENKDAFAVATAAEKLPDGLYRLGEVPDNCGGARAALAWLMGGYSFDRYKNARRARPGLRSPKVWMAKRFRASPKACFWGGTWSTRPPMTWGPRNWKKRHARWPNAGAPEFRSPAERHWPKTIP